MLKVGQRIEFHNQAGLRHEPTAGRVEVVSPTGLVDVYIYESGFVHHDVLVVPAGRRGPVDGFFCYVAGAPPESLEERIAALEKKG